MRHRKTGRGLGRTASHRHAMFRNMATSLFLHERIETTEAKAKELGRFVDGLLTIAKRGDTHARRLVFRDIKSKPVLKKLFGPLAERYAGRPGGFTRAVKIGSRMGDCAPMVLLELVDTDVPVRVKKKERRAEK